MKATTTETFEKHYSDSDMWKRELCYAGRRCIQLLLGHCIFTLFSKWWPYFKMAAVDFIDQIKVINVAFQEIIIHLHLIGSIYDFMIKNWI